MSSRGRVPSSEPSASVPGGSPPSVESRRDQLVGLVCHELRGPLNTILGWAHILHEAGDDRALVREAAEAIQRSARQQERTIGDLLDMSRLVSSGLEDALVAHGDAERLRLAAWHLFANAIRVTPEGGSVLVRLSRRGRELELALSEDGPGLASAGPALEPAAPEPSAKL